MGKSLTNNPSDKKIETTALEQGGRIQAEVTSQKRAGTELGRATGSKKGPSSGGGHLYGMAAGSDSSRSKGKERSTSSQKGAKANSGDESLNGASKTSNGFISDGENGNETPGVSRR